MNWILVIIVLVAVYIKCRKVLAPIEFSVPIIEGYHNPLHYNKQRVPDIDSYKRLSIMPRSPTYR
jgi:hypothetical protein